MKNIHITPTPNPSRLFYSGNSSVLTLNKYSTLFRASERSTQYVHITSDEEIKDGWVYSLSKNTILNVQKIHSIDLDIMLVKDIYGNISEINKTDCKKIVLTTDPKLIKDGVQAIDDEFLEWFVKNPSCEFVELVNYNPFSDNRFSIIIPKEESNYNGKDEILWISNNLQCKQVESCYNSLSKKCICPKEKPKQECKDCNESLEDCTCIEDTINMEQETIEEYFLSSIKNMLQFNNDALAIRFMEKYYHAKMEQDETNHQWKIFESEYNTFINSGGLNGETGEGWINHSKLIPWLKKNYRLIKK